MVSEEVNDAYRAKLDDIIQFFMRERESKIHHIVFHKENNASIYAKLITIIAILFTIPSTIKSGTPTTEVDFLVNLFLLILISSMFGVNILMYKDTKNQNVEYKNATHKFDVIISSLQIFKISNQDEELSKLICATKKQPVESEENNESYKKWLDNVYHCVTQLSACD